MKVVILAAGKGTRMNKLTEKMPKALLGYQKESLLEHKFKNLPDSVDEVILIVGYLGNQINEHFGDRWNGKKIQYIEQKELLGTAHSLWQAKDLLSERFLVLYGDDLYSKDDLEKLIKEEGWVVQVWPEDSITGGRCVIDAEGYLVNIIENDPENKTESGFIWTGACVLTPDIFKYEMAPLKGKHEFGLPQTFIRALPDRKIKTVVASWWKRVTSPEDLE